MSQVKVVPDGYPRLTPYLIVRDGPDAVDFYTKAFGARERMRLSTPDGKIGHTELEIFDSLIMLADEAPEMGAVSPATVGGTPVTLCLYVDDVDAVVEQAVAAGARLSRPVEDRFYGDRSGEITDPFGHRWSIASHIEDVAPEEMERRAAEAAAT